MNYIQFIGVIVEDKHEYFVFIPILLMCSLITFILMIVDTLLSRKSLKISNHKYNILPEVIYTLSMNIFFIIILQSCMNLISLFVFVKNGRLLFDVESGTVLFLAFFPIGLFELMRNLECCYNEWLQPKNLEDIVLEFRSLLRGRKIKRGSCFFQTRYRSLLAKIFKIYKSF